MQHRSTRRLLFAAAGAGLGLALTLPDLVTSARSVASPSFAEAVGGLANLGLAALSLWLLVASAAVAFALRTGAGTRIARRIAPAWLATALSTGALLLAPTAQATPADLDGLPLPDRAPAVAASDPPDHQVLSPGPASAGAGTVVVRAGDCLWDLAREHAGPAATDREVAALTTAWHQTNLTVIGSDPDLLRPGQVLTIPTRGQVAP